VVATAVGATGAPEAPAFQKLDVFAQALSYIENNYVDAVDDEALMYGAVKGMVGKLDRFSTFLPPEEYRRLREDTEGEYGGVGIVVEADDQGVPVVVDVVPKSPADRAGLQVADRILAIDGVATAGTDQNWRGTLRGVAGTRVNVEVQRTHWIKTKQVSLVRERIRTHPVEARTLDQGVAYVRIRQFQGSTTADVRKQLRAAKKKGGGAVPGLVLDLRGNPGGLFEQAVSVADLFLEEGLIVTVKSRLGQIEEHSAHVAGTWTGFPMTVILDQGSASSAEIVAGALQDHGRAVIVGTPSFGKGSVQTFLSLDDGSGLKLTTSRYYTPDGRSIEGSGIVPDTLVERSDEQVETAYQTLHTLGLSN